MPAFTPKFLAQVTRGRWTREPLASNPVTGFTVDSRHLTPGQCFIALKTDKRDGHAYLSAAQAAGAVAAIVSASDPSLDLPQLVVANPLVAFQKIAAAHRRAFPGVVIGVSGSAGKTSTKELLALLLSAKAGEVLATQGNLNNHLGVPLTLTRLDADVHKFAVIEAGIGAPKEMRVLTDMIAPDHALITLIGPAHLEELGSLKNVAREKSLLPAAVPGDGTGIKVFPASCLEYKEFRSLAAPTLVLTPVVSHVGDRTQIEFSFVPVGKKRPKAHVFTCRRVSDGMGSNAALALALALYLGVKPAAAQKRLDTWQPAALRGELCQDHAGRWLYVDCYNANPASMNDALSAFAGFSPEVQPRLYIIGGMEELGDESLAYHRRFGVALAAALRPQDRALVLATPATSEAVVTAANDRRVEAAVDLAAMRARFANHSGAVFIKGSRRYQLESLLLPNVTVAETSGVGH